MALRIQALALMAGLLAFSGCDAPGGGKSSAPQTAATERKPPPRFERILPEEDGLDTLREQERQQIARMDSLKQSIETDADQLRREEAVLRNIRNRMTEAQTAEQRSRQVMANREQARYDDNVQMNSLERDLYRGPPQQSEQPMPAMRQPARSHYENSAARMSSDAGVATIQAQPEPRAGLLMQQPPAARQPQQQYDMAQYAHPAQMPVQAQAQRQQPVNQPMARPMPQQVMMANDDIIWDPPANLFTGQPPQPQQPARPQAHAASMPQPAAPAPAVKQVPVGQAVLPKLADEVFTPDLFLSAGV